MKNIERGSIKYLVILIIAVAVCGVVLYPLFDLILCKFITRSNFIYSIHNHIIQPILFALIFGTTFWIVDKNRKVWVKGILW